MLTTYLAGALITAMATFGGVFWFSDPRTDTGPLVRIAVAFLAGALWPVVAVFALLSIVIVPLLV